MQQMMRQMGIQQQEINATEVIIKTADKEFIITNPSVAKVNMMGQETFQISGEITERELSSTSLASEISEEDIKTAKLIEEIRKIIFENRSNFRMH